jgi:hypothetical protein
VKVAENEGFNPEMAKTIMDSPKKV